MMRIGRKSQDNRKLTAKRIQEYNWFTESTLKKYTVGTERNEIHPHLRNDNKIMLKEIGYEVD